MKEINPELKKLILWRLDVGMPSNFKLSIGNKGTFTKEQLKYHVEKEDEIGRSYIDMQLKFIKALTNGELSRALSE